jgi:tetratricopeptide (TPR) repeat protein
MAAHQKALAIREALASDLPDDVLVENDVSRTHRNIGSLYRDVGKSDEALTEWEKAITISRALLKRPLPKGDGRVDLTGRSDPSAIIREDLASLLLDCASVVREAGRLGDAQTNWEQARALFEALVRELPEYPHLRSRLADVYQEGAALDTEAGRFAQALPLVQRGLEIAERLAADNPSIAYYHSLVAGCLIKLGWLLGKLGRTPEALAAFARSVDIAEGLVADEPSSDWRRSLLAQCLTQNGNLLLGAGRPADALPQLRRSVEIQDAVVRAHPELIGNVSSLASCVRGLGRAEAGAGRTREARDAFARASEIDLSLADKYPACRYNLACSLALMLPVVPPARRDDLARRAMDALKRSWADGGTSLASVKDDHDLDSLRDRPDFREFLLDMAFPADPFAPRD